MDPTSRTTPAPNPDATRGSDRAGAGSRPLLRILVTGSRRMHDPEPIRKKVMAYIAEITVSLNRPKDFGNARIVLVHGAGPGSDGAPGCDALVARVAREFGFTAEAHPPERFGPWPQCGPRRNAHMVTLGADICFAFPGPHSVGTWDCAGKCCRAHIPVRTYLQPN